MKYSRENIGEGGLLLVLVTPRTDAINLVNWTRSNSILLEDWRLENAPWGLSAKLYCEIPSFLSTFFSAMMALSPPNRHTVTK